MNKIISLYLIFFLLINPVFVFSNPVKDDSDIQRAAQSETSDNTRLKNKETELTIIIDAHENIQAQFNIAKLIDEINSESPLSSVFIEGASGEVNPGKYFNIFDDKKISSSVFNYLLKKGFITGTEYWHLLSTRKTVLRGAENPVDYRNNIKHLIKLKQLSNKDTISPLITYINNMLRDNLPENTTELDKQYITMIIDGKNVLNFVYSLIQEYSSKISANRTKYPILSKFLMFSRKSSKINSDLLKAISAIKEKNNLDQKISEQAGSLKKQLIFAKDQVNSLHDSIDFIYNHKTDVDKFLLNKIISYYENAKFINNLSTSKIYLGILKEYKTLFCDSSRKNELFQSRDSLLGLYKGCDINLTSSEYSYFDIDKINPASYLNTLISNSHSSDFIINEILKTNRIEQIYQIKQTVCDFYNTVEKRNNSILENIYKHLLDGEKAVLVVGGYHKNICEQIKQRGIKVNVITPEVKLFEKNPRDVSYSDYLSGKFTELEKMIYYSWSTIVSPIVSQDINSFSTKQDAVPTIISRQIALMIGTSLLINQTIADQSSRESINAQIAAIQKQAASSNYSINNFFSALEGTGNEPQWPKVTRFDTIAGKDGIFVTFKLANQLLGLELIKQDAILSTTEKNSIAAIRTGHVTQESIIYNGNVYNLALSNIITPYENTSDSEEQKTNDFRESKEQTKENYLIELLTPFITDIKLAYGNAQIKKIEASFVDKIDSAVSAKDLDGLYDIYDYFTNIIESKSASLSYLESLTDLDADKINLIKQQINSIIDTTLFYKTYLELKIADLGGELRGFKFIKPLGSGSWGNVYLAKKDGQLWAVKLLKLIPSISHRDFSEGKLKHFKEALATISVYDDVYTGYSGQFNKGENLFIAVPYKKSNTLRAKENLLPQNIKDRLNISLSLTNEMAKIQKNGFIFNDLKPENILLYDKDNSVRIIDFGCCFSKKFPPRSIDQLTIGSTRPYRSPELQTLTEILDSLEIELGMAYLTPIKDIDFDFLDRIEYFLRQGLPYINDIEKYNDLIYNILPVCYAKLSEGEFSSVQELIDLVEKDLLACLYSMIDHRSDIYALGIILRDDIFKDVSNPEIDRIIAKACNEDPNMRYESFNELFNDLNAVSNPSAGLINEKVIAAHFIGERPKFDRTLLTETVQSWETFPFSNEMYDDVLAISEYLSFSQESMQKIVEKTLKPKTYAPDGNVAAFQKIVEYLANQLGSMKGKKDYLEFKLKSEPRPIRIHLVSHNNLRKLGVSGLTIPSDNRIDMYLPGNLLSTRYEIFLQIFKHELDEYIFNLPHTTSVLLEPLMHHYGYIRIGKASRRTLYEFQRRIYKTFLSGDLEALYAIKEEFKSLMRNEQQVIAEIDQNNLLSAEEKKFAKRLAKDISNEAKFFSYQTDNYIARLGGTLNGFKFIKKLGSGVWGTVYLAVKDEKLWAVKLLNVKRDKKTLALSDRADISIEMHKNEIGLTDYAYGDVYKGKNGNFEQGDNQLIAVPFFEGETLSARFIGLSNDEVELIDTTLPIIKELMGLEKKGILFNDFNPNNIYFKTKTNKVRFIDFGCAMRSGITPDKLAKVTIGATTPFISPEFQICRKLRANLASVFDLLSSTPFEKLKDEFPDIFEVFLSQAMHAGADKQLYKEIQTILFASASKKMETGEIKSQNELIDFIEPELVKFVLTLVDIRSDIFSFGKLLEQEVFIEDPSPEISRIIKKATSDLPEDRYQSFDELYSDLMSYRESIGTDLFNVTHNIPLMESTEKPITAHFIGINPTLNTAYIKNLKPMPITKTMRQNLNSFHDYLADKNGSIKTILTSTLHPDDKSADGGFARFNTILENFNAELAKKDDRENVLTLSLAGQSRPLNIYLVSLDQLKQAGVSALTVPHDDKIDMYLPYDYFNVNSITTFLEIFKHEIDEFIFSTPHTLSVLYESAFTASSSEDIGTASERVIKEFQEKINKAVSSNNLSELYSTKNYFDNLIANEQVVKTEILENKKLTPIQQEYAVKLAENITRLSIFFKIQLENAIAEKQGTINGYKFIKKFTESENYSIYIVQKNNILFFIKILKPQQDSINQLAESQLNEINLINLIYNDVPENLSDDIKKGKTLFYPVPFNDGSMLPEILLSETEPELLKTALLITDQAERVEQNNIVCNNITPQNIFINESMTSARFFDFTGSIDLKNLPVSIDSFNIPKPSEYHSPEYINLYSNLQRLKNKISQINETPIQSLDPQIFDDIESILRNMYTLSNRKDILDKLATTTIPEIKLSLANKKITSAKQIVDLIIPDAITFMANTIDSRSDIYSLGILLANNLFHTVTSHELDNIISKATNPDKTKRFTNVNELQDALKTYLENITLDKQPQQDETENVTFGTISETDHRRIGGLNSKIRRFFTGNISEQNPIEELELIQTQIQIWAYDNISKNSSIDPILQKMGITDNEQWINFVTSLTDRLKNASIYFLPADSFMLWVGNQFAAAHYGKYNHKDNIYLTAPLMDVMESQEKGVIILHEMLHIMGFSHEDAESFLSAVIPEKNMYQQVKEFVFLIAELESIPVLQRHGRKNFNQFIAIMTPVLKQAVTQGKVLSQNNFRLILKKLNFEPAFIDLAYKQVNAILFRISKGEMPSKKMESNLSDTTLNTSPEHINSLIIDLIHQDGLQAIDAIDELIGIGEPAIKILTGSLKSQNTIKLKNILFILGEMGNPSVFEDISGLFNHDYPDVRQSAFEAADKLVTQDHAGYLQQILTEANSSETLSKIISLLKKIDQTPDLDNNHFIENPDKEIRDLTELLLNEQGIDRSEQIKSAGAIWTQINHLAKIDDTPHLETALDKLRELGEQALPYLRLSSQWDNTDITAWSAFLLAEHKDISAVKPLLKTATSFQGMKREQAVKFLLIDEYEDELIKFIQSESSVLTEQAIDVLRQKKSVKAVPVFQKIILDREGYSISVRSAALKALSELSNDKNLSQILNEIAKEILKPYDRAFDDKLILLEIAVIVKNRKLRKSDKILRIFLREQSIQLKKAAIEGLGVVGKYSDISTIQLFARLYPELLPAAKKAAVNLNALDKYLASFIGFFLAGEPNKANLSSDNNIHKNELTGVQDIINFSDFNFTPFSIKSGADTYRFNLHTDTDFEAQKHITSITSNDITEILENILKNNVDVCRGLHGKTIYLSLLDSSYRLTESHLSDSFIGFNEALLTIQNKKHLKTLLSVLILHELKHEAGIAPLEGNQLLYFEQSEFINMMKTLYDLFPDKTELNKFIDNISPAFAENAFFIHVLRSLANENISIPELQIIFKLNIADPSNELIKTFYSELTNKRDDSFNITERLSQLGLLSQDILELLDLPPDSHLKGDLGNLNSLSPFIKNKIHNILMEEYLKQLVPELIKHENTSSLFSLFFNSYEKTTINAREKINSYKSRIMENKKLSSLSDSDFIAILAADLIYSKFTGENEGLFLLPDFHNLIEHIESAFNNSSIIDLQTISVENRISIVEQLFTAATSRNIPVGLNNKPEPTQSDNLKVNLDKSANVIIETSM